MEFIRLDPTRKTAQQLCDSQCFVQTAPDDGDKCEDSLKKFLNGAPGKAIGWYKTRDGAMCLEVENHQGRGNYFHYGPTKWQAEECPDQELAKQAFEDAKQGKTPSKKPQAPLKEGEGASAKAETTQGSPHPEITDENKSDLVADIEAKFSGKRVKFVEVEEFPRSKSWQHQHKGGEGVFVKGTTYVRVPGSEAAIGWAYVKWDNGHENEYPVFIKGLTSWNPDTHEVGDACLVIVEESEKAEEEGQEDSQVCILIGGDGDPDEDTCDECGADYCPACEEYHHEEDCSRY